MENRFLFATGSWMLAFEYRRYNQTTLTTAGFFVHQLACNFRLQHSSRFAERFGCMAISRSALLSSIRPAELQFDVDCRPRVLFHFQRQIPLPACYADVLLSCNAGIACSLVCLSVWLSVHPSVSSPHALLTQKQKTKKTKISAHLGQE